MTIAAEPRHYADQLLLSLQRRESAYNVALEIWDSSTSTLMADYAQATAHELWDDRVVGAELIRQGRSTPDSQAMAQHSVRIAYTQPRVTPHTLAGLMGLAMGRVQTDTQAFLPLAYRHALTLADPVDMPSISGMTGHQLNHYYVYGGLKAEGFTLSLTQGSPYLSFTCPLVGAGSRTLVSPSTFPLRIAEDWLRIGDCHVYLADVTDAPLVVGGVSFPTQGTTNLGAGALDLSSRVLALRITQQNVLGVDHYRVSTGLERAQCYATQQAVQVALTLEVETATEGAELAWYLNQRHLAFELQCYGAAEITPVAILNLTTGTPPTHHVLADPVSGTWYVWIIPGMNALGELMIDSTPPAGTGLNAGLGLDMRAMDGYRYRMGAATNMNGDGEVTTEQRAFVGIDPHVIEIVTLADPVGTLWYLWHDSQGNIVISRTPVPIMPWRTGVTLLCPHMQWRALVRQEQEQCDVLELTGTVLNDGTQAPVFAWVHNAVPAYLQAG